MHVVERLTFPILSPCSRISIRKPVVIIDHVPQPTGACSGRYPAAARDRRPRQTVSGSGNGPRGDIAQTSIHRTGLRWGLCDGSPTAADPSRTFCPQCVGFAVRRRRHDDPHPKTCSHQKPAIAMKAIPSHRTKSHTPGCRSASIPSFAWIASGELAARNLARKTTGRPRWKITLEALAAFELGKELARLTPG